jgi:hypothetical protein
MVAGSVVHPTHYRTSAARQPAGVRVWRVPPDALAPSDLPSCSNAPDGSGKSFAKAPGEARDARPMP